MDLPNELKIEIFQHWTLNDFKRHYFNFKCVKDILDYLIVKKNLTFIGRFDMILDQIVFQYYSNAFDLVYSKYSLFNGFIEAMFEHKELSIKIWEEKCLQYNYTLPYMPKILGFMFEGNELGYLNGEYKYDKNDIYQRVFFTNLINYLNH